MILPDYNCVLCPSTVEESLTHLFIHCPFSQACWASIGLNVSTDDPFDNLDQFKHQLVIPFFMEIIVLMSWSIWMQRNDSLFKGILSSPSNCLQNFRKELALVILRAKSKYKTAMSEWLEAFV